MTPPTFTPAMISALLPELLLLALAGLVLLVDLFLRPWRSPRRSPGPRPSTGPGGPPAVLPADVDGVGDGGEYFFLVIGATLGLCLMAAAADLILLYLAIETASISLYVLAGYLKRDDRSTESGLKYFLFGALTSAVMLYGFSLLFGAPGQRNLYLLADQVRQGGVSVLFVGGAAILVFVGFAFKISAVPFHFWTPDVYEGAPRPATAFISTASKVAGFAVLLRFLLAFAA